MDETEILLPPDSEMSAVPVESAAALEVVDADQVVQRIVETVQAAMEAQAAQEEPETTPEPTPEPTEEVEPEETEPVPMLVQDAGSEETRELLSSIQAEVTGHPLLTTPFEDYTVTEGLLLLLLILAFVAGMLKVLRGGISWLLS